MFRLTGSKKGTMECRRDQVFPRLQSRGSSRINVPAWRSGGDGRGGRGGVSYLVTSHFAYMTFLGDFGIRPYTTVNCQLSTVNLTAFLLESTSRCSTLF